MANIIGIVLFALGIGLAVAVHEFGHMLTAKAFGMRVRRYFIGFGPKIWSFRRGETEYGLKLIPAGGFCDIAGMTSLDEVTPEEAPLAMWRFKTWKRVVVMVSGPASHFVIGFIILYIMSMLSGMPNFQDKPILQDFGQCAQSQTIDANGNVTYSQCAPNSVAPAKAGGLQPNDQIVTIAGKPIATWDDVLAVVKPLHGPTPVVVDRNGHDVTLSVNIAQVSITQTVNGKTTTTKQGALGVLISRYFQYNAVTGLGAAASVSGQIFSSIWDGIALLPQKVPALFRAIGGAPRDPSTPISVVGASRLGGQFVEFDLWPYFWFFLAMVNFGLGLFNLLPLLPLDGGHILVSLYERVRDWLRRAFGRQAGGPVDYTRLIPVTLFVVAIGGAYMVVAVIADIVNPIKLGGS
ncbi:MAG TPA: site-2 protease family protein [Pseudonocardiaceae bacterium]|jgi:membrane-associated protease RseP (regulator of RpoE activity)|nr:site-2 protease family protein [Pseudonocardiaceae bacterium]